MPDVVPNPDPFTIVYDALWRMLERNKYILDNVKLDNRTKFDEAQDQLPGNTEADLPHISLLCSGGSYGGKDNRDMSTITRNYEWLIQTGDFRLSPLYNPLMFQIYRSLVDWECILCNLMWCDCTFVNGFRMTEHAEGRLFQDEDDDEPTPGWTSLWTCQVDFSFPKKLLKLPSNDVVVNS